MPRKKKKSKPQPLSLSAAEVLKIAKREERRWNVRLIQHPEIPHTYIVQKTSLRK